MWCDLFPVIIETRSKMSEEGVEAVSTEEERETLRHDTRTDRAH